MYTYTIYIYICISNTSILNYDSHKPYISPGLRPSTPADLRLRWTTLACAQGTGEAGGAEPEPWPVALKKWLNSMVYGC